MPLLAGLHRWYAKQRLRQATIAAAIAGVGAVRERWALAAAPDDLVIAIQTWLVNQLSQVRTPRGIDTCGLLLKLVAYDGSHRRLLWTAQIPDFARHAPQPTLQLLDQRIRRLPLTIYPAATHLEVQLVSIGDIVAYHDQGR